MPEEIDFRCEDCQAEPGSPCVYANPKFPERASQPTKRPHHSRYRSCYLWERQAERMATLEYLRWWLLEFGDIFSA